MDEIEYANTAHNTIIMSTFAILSSVFDGIISPYPTVTIVVIDQ